MTLRNFNDLCKELLRTDVHYINKDLNIDLQDYYHTTSWMINKLSLIKILGDYIPIPGKDAQGHTTDNWQNLALSYASNMFNKTNESCLKSGNIINLNNIKILSGPYVGMTFGTFDSIYKTYAPTFVDASKKWDGLQHTPLYLLLYLKH